MSHCTSCGARLAPGARFCAGCGAPVAADPDATIPTPVGGASDPDATTPAPARRPTPAPAHSASRSVSHSSSAPPSAEGLYAPGTLIADRYRIVGLLGRGGMGEVYRADDLTLGQSVALKFLPESVGHSHDRRERFMNEVRVAREVAHPNVCRVYDIGEVDDRVFLSMEYIDGEDLSSLLRRIGRLPQEKAIEIARSLCAGLGALHDRGVLHRDLKPANVMVDGRGRVRITDFGLAGLGKEIVGAEARAGTPAYMAPEQLAGERADERSDIYALGLTLYEVFTGKRAFEADSVAEISRLQRESTPPSASSLVPDLDESVERVLNRCLDADSGSRPPSAYAVAAALPGGDPLAAALAAGEVPSIEMVAAAGKAGGVRPLVGVLCLLASVVGVVLYAGTGAQRAVYHWDAMEKPPAVLHDRAREIAADLGYDEPPADETRGFDGDGRALRWVAALDSSRTDWNRLRDRRPAAMHFWYRRSPEHLQSIRPEQIPTYDDPPMDVAGMVRLKLDTRGRLLDFEAVPPQHVAADADTAAAAADSAATGSEADSTPAVDWDAVLAAAGFDPAALREVESEWVPAHHADERVAWRGTLPEDPDVEIRLEGAAYEGRPVSFRLIGDWSHAERMPTGTPDRSDFAVEATLIALLVAIMAAVLALAIRNVRNGRGDRPGARRLSRVVFFTMMTMWVLRTNHGSSPSTEINMFFEAVSQSLLAAGLFWTAYLALEPFVRSTWPRRIVAWSRLLTGRWKDPLVGREILVGAVFFLVTVALGVVRIQLQEAMGHGAPRPSSLDDGVFLGVAGTVSSLLGVTMNSVFNGFFFFLLLLLLKMLCRKMSIATVVFVVLFVGTFWATRSGPEREVAPYMGFVVGIVWLTVMLRFGLLAFIVGFLFRQIAYTFPMTLDSSAWYMGTSTFAAAVIAGITAVGLWLALSARSSPGDLFDR